MFIGIKISHYGIAPNERTQKAVVWAVRMRLHQARVKITDMIPVIIPLKNRGNHVFFDEWRGSPINAYYVSQAIAERLNSLQTGMVFV